jgi:hypothetical protein
MESLKSVIFGTWAGLIFAQCSMPIELQLLIGIFVTIWIETDEINKNKNNSGFRIETNEFNKNNSEFRIVCDRGTQT